MKTTITVERAAQLLGTTPMSIREIIAHNTLPIGIMLPKKKGAEKRTFKIFAYKVSEITGIPIEEVVNGRD